MSRWRLSFVQCLAQDLSILIALALLLLMPGSLLAQSYRGSIRGHVVDPSGGVMAGAKVTAKNSATGLTRETVTGGDGGYVLAELAAGRYVVMAQAPNLNPVAQNVIVNVGLDTTADFDLTQVERRQEQVTVTGEPPLVESTRDVLGEVVDQQLVTELPLERPRLRQTGGAGARRDGRAFGCGRHPVRIWTVQHQRQPRPLQQLQPGRHRQQRSFLQQFRAEPGGHHRRASIPVAGRCHSGIQPSIAIRRRVRAQHRIGGQHPDPLRHQSSARIGVRILSQLRARCPQLLQHRSAQDFVPEQPVWRVPGRTDRQGQDVLLRSLRGTARAGRVGLHPRSSHELSSAPMRVHWRWRADSRPSIQRSTHLLDLYPSSTTGSAAAVVRDKNDMDSFIVKLDHNFTETEQVSGRYAFARSEQVFPLGSQGGFGDGSRLPQFAQTSPTRVQVVSGSLLSSLEHHPHQRNPLRLQPLSHVLQFAGCEFRSGKLWDSILATANSDCRSSISRCLSKIWVRRGFSIPRGRTSQSFQILDNFTWLHGRHTFKFGGEYRRAAIENFNDNEERGIFSFGPDPSVLTPCNIDPSDPLCADPVTLSLANFYLGDAFVLALAGDTHRTTYNNGLTFFAQDDFRVRPNFTLNLGVRWEYFGPLSEKNNLLSNLGRGRHTGDGGHGWTGRSLRSRPQQLCSARRLRLERASEDRRAWSLWGLLRLRAATSDAGKFHSFGGSGDQPDWAASRCFRLTFDQTAFTTAGGGPILSPGGCAI